MCPLRPDPCQKSCLCRLSLSLSFCLSGCFDGDVFLFLSGAGETQTPFGVWVSPCDSSSWTRTTCSTRTPCSSLSPRSPPRLVFFFFLFRRRSRGSFLGVVLAVLSVCLSVCLPVHARPCFRTVGGVGRQDISHPIFDCNYGLFLGYGVRADVPCVCLFLWHTESASPPPPPSCRTL